MSADNGVYILKTKDQYRVTHAQGIDRIYDSIDGDWQRNKLTNGKYNPVRVVEIWGICKYTRDESVALKIAHDWASSLPVCEYGVNIMSYNKTWKHILEDAQKWAKREIKCIESCSLEHCYNMKRLHKIADGVYLDEWVNRNKNRMEKSNETNI